MMKAQMLDDDRRLHDRAAVVDQQRKALQRPEPRPFHRILRVIGVDRPEVERGRVLVERDEHLLAVGGKGVAINLECHVRLRPPMHCSSRRSGDRQSVVWGKGGSGRVELGGRGKMTKTKK